MPPGPCTKSTRMSDWPLSAATNSLIGAARPMKASAPAASGRADSEGSRGPTWAPEPGALAILLSSHVGRSTATNDAAGVTCADRLERSHAGDLDQVAAGVVQDGGGHRSHLRGFLREADAEAAQPFGLRVHVGHREGCERDPVGH